MRLLALDTATELCSAALWLDGVVSAREDARPRASSELILGMIDSLLSERGIGLREIDAIAFGRGPGSFTGVRLAAAVAQGLGYAAGRPLLPVSDLRAVAQQAVGLPGAPERVLVCQDARLHQVYWACFECAPDFEGASDRIVQAGAAEAVSDPAQVQLPIGWQDRAAWGAGSGFDAYPDLRQRFGCALTGVHGALRPRAIDIARLAAHDGLAAAVPPADAQPVYLRDEVAVAPQPN